MRTALVLSGGGSKGAFSVGVLEVLLEKGYSFDLIAGTSTGALIAPLAAIGDIKAAVEIYTSVKTRDILRHNWRKLYKTAIYDDTPLKRLIRRYMFHDDVVGDARYQALMEKVTPPVLLCSASLQTRQVMYFSQREMDGVQPWKSKEGFVSALLGSTNQPLLMPASDHHEHQLVDGGVREIAPIEVAVKLGLERVIAVVNIPESKEGSTERYSNLLSVGARTLSLMTDEILLNDIRTVVRYNKMLRHIEDLKAKALTYVPASELDELFASDENPCKDKKYIEVTVIRPESQLPSDGLDFDPQVMGLMMEKGREAARAALT